MRDVLLETGGKVTPVLQWQKVWSDCVLLLCGKFSSNELRHLAEEISEQKVEGAACLFPLLNVVKCKRKDKLRKVLNKKEQHWISLVVQWLRIHQPMLEIQVRSLFRKIPHAAGQLSLSQLLRLCASAAEACALQIPCSTREATTMGRPHTTTTEQPLLAATREARAAMKTQSSQK